MSTLFTAVSVEQQEIVAGGAAIALETLNQFAKKINFGATSGTNVNGAFTSVDISEIILANSELNFVGTNA